MTTITFDLVGKYLTIFLPFFGFLAYWIKRRYDYKTRQMIRFNLFCQNKINAIKEFYSSYMEFAMTFNTYSVKLFTQGRERDFDKFFIPARDKLFSSYSHIKLFIAESNISPYKRIIDRNVDLYNETFRIALGIGIMSEW